MKITNILLVYKKSIYEIYFNDQRQKFKKQNFKEEDIAHFKESGRIHKKALETVCQTLKSHKIRFHKIYRANKIDPEKFDLVISVGGDGTFLEAARYISDQPIIGINSDPTRSAGYFCSCTADNFDTFLSAILNDRAIYKSLNRMKISINEEEKPISVINDLLISHQCPGAMSRYSLKLGSFEESHRGSGMWLSTAAGSTGAINSAGGKKMPLGSMRLQYLIREPYVMNKPYTLSKGMIKQGETVEIRSEMREGMIYVDGSHMRYEFPFGAKLTVSNASCPLKLITGKA